MWLPASGRWKGLEYAGKASELAINQRRAVVEHSVRGSLVLAHDRAEWSPKMKFGRRSTETKHHLKVPRSHNRLPYSTVDLGHTDDVCDLEVTEYQL